jgi:3-oxoadipyl-CoA thiolase
MTLCDAARTPIGRFGGALAKVRTDDLAAVPIKALMARNPSSTGQLDDVSFRLRQPGRRGQPQCGAHGAVAGRPAGQRSGPDAQPALRLGAGRGRRRGARHPRRRNGFAIAGGVESMTRAPFVMGKAPEAFSRSAEIYDTTIGWRFINPLMKAQYGVDAMPETGENVAEEFQVSRADQDAFATALAAARREGHRVRLFRQGNRAGRNPGGKAGP